MKYLQPVYDIVNCGPRHRFVANGKLVHNSDGVNLQNLPARSGKQLKSAIEAPSGYLLVDCDSSNIEARMLAWLAQQDDLVTDFANKVDVYCKMASHIYNMTITKDNSRERFVGKTVTLGCGYQTGAGKLQATLKAATPSVDLPIEECKRIVDTYREVNYMIPRLWREADRAIQAMHDDQGMWLGREGVVWVDGRRGIKLPNGMYIQYPQLHKRPDPETGKLKWVYKDRAGLADIYGGKLVENVVQALARIVVMYQLLNIKQRYKVALTVHDSVLAVVPERDIIVGREYIEQCMRWVPKWAGGCPINCESKIGRNYGEMKE